MKKFLSRKFLITIVTLTTLVVVGSVWVAQRMVDKGLWALWFGAVNLIVGSYEASNVVAKKKSAPSDK